ncbi:hypothetical protein VTJ49DRAFT_5798 [Mycothermus thermophilus]|uniref:Uncharacterized protein n=1 Tax=Humicola insolens TaxID=85995 RepID=A0ABR3VQ66_HUMIN
MISTCGCFKLSVYFLTFPFSFSSYFSCFRISFRSRDFISFRRSGKGVVFSIGRSVGRSVGRWARRRRALAGMGSTTAFGRRRSGAWKQADGTDAGFLCDVVLYFFSAHGHGGARFLYRLLRPLLACLHRMHLLGSAMAGVLHGWMGDGMLGCWFLMFC